MTNTLPVFKGYTVDYRLREFRKMNYGELTKTIPFNSTRGGRLLEQYEASLVLIHYSPYKK